MSYPKNYNNKAKSNQYINWQLMSYRDQKPSPNHVPCSDIQSGIQSGIQSDITEHTSIGVKVAKFRIAWLPFHKLIDLKQYIKICVVAWTFYLMAPDFTKSL